MKLPGTDLTLVCPSCQGPLSDTSSSYQCDSCKLSYPVLNGIADFRLRSDPYLSLEQERDKARQLAAQSASGFEGMLDYYYQITDDVPPELAARYKAYHLNGPQQAQHSLAGLDLNPQDTFLDAGCGTGGALISAARTTKNLVGVDIALRWLVICQQRLREENISATLICADVESLPFPQYSFNKILATDLLENVYSVENSLEALSHQLQTTGKLWVSGSNKYCLGPHPTTRLWAIGYFPKKFRQAITTRLRGIDSLRYIQLISPTGIVRLGKRLGLQPDRLSPKTIETSNSHQYPWSDRMLIGIYTHISACAMLRKILLMFGPAFEILFAKPLTENKKELASS